MIHRPPWHARVRGNGLPGRSFFGPSCLGAFERLALLGPFALFRWSRGPNSLPSVRESVGLHRLIPSRSGASILRSGRPSLAFWAREGFLLPYEKSTVRG